MVEVYCYTTVTSRLPEAGPAYIWLFLGHRLSSQTNTSLLYALCPHSCAPGKNFPVGHPSRNCSRPSTLNFGVLSRLASRKEDATYWHEYSINPIKPWAGMSQWRDIIHGRSKIHVKMHKEASANLEHGHYPLALRLVASNQFNFLLVSLARFRIWWRGFFHARGKI